MKPSQGPSCKTGISYLIKVIQSLKTYEDYTNCRERCGQCFNFLDFQRNLLFATSSGPSKASLSFKTATSISRKRLSPSRQNASAHRAVTRETLVELHWEILPHTAYSSDLAQRGFHLMVHSKRP